MQQPTSQRSPVISTLSIAIALLLLAGLGLAALLSGGAIFNPGPVSAKSSSGGELGGYGSHAEFENRCNLCHQPLQSEQAPLCLKCHEKVAAQIDQKTGTHGRLEDASRCAACHGEHKGRDFDPTTAALESFDHRQTRLPLNGKHAALDCQECHQNGVYDQADPQCSSCHKEPPAHAGMFGLDCAACHSDRGWKPANYHGQAFNHEQTRFTLAHHTKDYAGKPLACTDCHAGPPDRFDPQTCSACHAGHDAAFMDKHTGQYGPDCLACHDGVDRMYAFDHARAFPLDGAHAALACESCHAEKKFRGTPTACAACHKEPEIHAGFFGQKCEYCHTSQAWQPALLHAHPFPLDHGAEKESDCTTCHSGPYQEYSCYACHDHQPDEIRASHTKAGISAEQLPNCAGCHLDGQVHPLNKP